MRSQHYTFDEFEQHLRGDQGLGWLVGPAKVLTVDGHRCAGKTRLVDFLVKYGDATKYKTLGDQQQNWDMFSYLDIASGCIFALDFWEQVSKDFGRHARVVFDRSTVTTAVFQGDLYPEGGGWNPRIFEDFCGYMKRLGGVAFFVEIENIEVAWDWYQSHRPNYQGPGVPQSVEDLYRERTLFRHQASALVARDIPVVIIQNEFTA